MTVTIRFEPSSQMANYSKIKEDESSQEQHCNHSRRRLEFRKARRCRRDIEETREDREKDREKGREEV